MYRFSLEVEIAAPIERVWRALSAPEEVIEWDGGVLRPLDAPPDYPKPGQHVRWQHRGPLFHVLHDRPLEVMSPAKLRSLLAWGPFRYDETYRLTPDGVACTLRAELQVWTPFPLVGAFLDRLYIGPAARRAFEAALASIKRHCESDG